MAEEDPWDAAWRELRRRHAIALVAWLAFPVLTMLTMGIAALALGAFDMTLLLGALPTMVLCGVVAWWGSLVRCPVCGKPFFRRGVYANTLARKCRNCGATRGARAAHAPFR